MVKMALWDASKNEGHSAPLRPPRPSLTHRRPQFRCVSTMISCSNCQSNNVAPVRKNSKDFFRRRFGLHRCLDCDARFHPPVPRWLGVIVVVIGVAIVCVTPVLAFPEIVGEQFHRVPGGRRAFILLALVGIAGIRYGYKVIMRQETKLR